MVGVTQSERPATACQTARVPMFYLYVPTPVELGRLLVGSDTIHHEMPPEGMGRGFDVAALAGQEIDQGGTSLKTALYVTGQPPEGTEDDWYWGTLGDFLLDNPTIDEAMAARLVVVIARIAGKLISEAAAIPLLKAGTRGGSMRWLRSTYRGILGEGVEQFQFKVDLGQPGSDPDLSEAAGLALAEQLAALWKTAWQQVNTHYDSGVQFTEVGVVQLNQTESTNVDGTGGNLSQSWDTQWTPYLVTDALTKGAGLGPTLPFEVACAISLQTDHRGPSGRGRLYMPPPAVGAMDYSGVFTVATVTDMLDAMALFLDTIDANTPHRAVVVSPRRLILNSVTTINCGKVPDSQRRRRRSQDEARVIRALA